MTSSRGRLRIAVLFGGRSAEHDVSVMSATNVMGALEPRNMRPCRSVRERGKASGCSRFRK